MSCDPKNADILQIINLNAPPLTLDEFGIKINQVCQQHNYKEVHIHHYSDGRIALCRPKLKKS